jgi:hypothetical protein
MINWITNNWRTSLSTLVVAFIALIICLFRDPFKDWFKPYGELIIGGTFGRLPRPSAANKPEKTNKAIKSTDNHSPEESPVDQLGLNAPDFRTYTEDTVHDLKWVWEWEDALLKTKRIDAIKLTGCFCRLCGIRIEPEIWHEPITEIIHGRPITGSPTRGRSFTRREERCSFKCDNGHATITRRWSLNEERGKVCRKIEERSHDPDEWQAAPERIIRAKS